MTRFNWQNPYPTPRLPVFARNIVSTSHPLAAQAGLRMLWKGGNAVDAAIAAAAAITVVEPVSCGLGGDAFALVWDGAKLHGLNASGVSPAAWNVDYFKRKYGEENGLANQPKRGWDAVTVPGVIAGWEALHGKFGSLPFARPDGAGDRDRRARPCGGEHRRVQVGGGRAGTEGSSRLRRNLHAARPRAGSQRTGALPRPREDVAQARRARPARVSTKARSPSRSPRSRAKAARR